MHSAPPSEVLGRRIGAAVIDLVVIGVLLVIVGLLFGQGYSHHGRVGVNLHGASVAVWAALSLAYYFLAEYLFSQTLGKRLLGIRVTSQAGDRPSAAAVGVRTLLRVVDFLPFLYLVGLVSILATRDRAQRLGDLAAKTTVTVAPDVHHQASVATH